MSRSSAPVVFAAMLLSVFVTRCVPAQEPPQGAAETKFQVAQHNVSTAVNLLEAYIRENPNAADVAAAKAQLSNLKGASPFSAVVSPVALGSREEGLEWWVTSVDAQPERTVVTLKIMNTHKIQEIGMYAFDTQPLAMFDNQWAFYPMQQAPAVPAGVRVQPWGQSRTMWWIQPQRVLTLEVVFAPLAPHATGGRLLYLRAPIGSSTTPAEFAVQNKGRVAK
jgi:hypothetical protein